MRLDLFFDYASPYAYLGATQAERVAAAHGAELVWRPLLLGGLFRSIGTADVPLLEMPPVKQRYQQADMQRWAAHWGVPLSFPTRFPMRTVSALRMTLQVPNERRGALALPLFRAYWAEDRDIADGDELTRIANDAGFDGAALLANVSDPEVKAMLLHETQAAEKAGVCGAPSFWVRRDEDDEGVLYWGQDRLDFVERSLDGWRPRAG
jgi:2-hydroxychromene-2-carboxylate isomerase